MKSKYYGWNMVAISAGVLATHNLGFSTIGIFLKPITTDFNWERGALSVAYSMNTLVAGGLGILAGRLSDRFGPRILITAYGVLAGISLLLMSRIAALWQAYLVWGLLMGIASSLSFSPIMSTIARWFTKRRGTATGLTMAGFGVGGIVWPILAQWLISNQGWRQAYIILGLITLIIILPLAQFMKQSPQKMKLKPYGESGTAGKEHILTYAEGSSLSQAIKTGRFWLFASLLFCTTFYIQVMMVHVVPYAIDIGITPSIAATLPSFLFGGVLGGRLFMGFASDRLGARQTLSFCLVMSLLAMILIQFFREIWVLYLSVIFFGIAFGGIFPAQAVITAELFGLKSLGAILAAAMVFGHSGGALGPTLAGTIFDRTGSYRLAFLISLLLCGLALAFSLALLRLKKSSVING